MRFQPGNNYGGKRPGSGRPPDEMRRLFRQLFYDAKCIERMRHFLKKTRNPDVFFKGVQIILDRGWGKPDVMIEHTGSLTLEQLVAPDAVLSFDGENGNGENSNHT